MDIKRFRQRGRQIRQAHSEIDGQVSTDFDLFVHSTRKK